MKYLKLPKSSIKVGLVYRPDTEAAKKISETLVPWLKERKIKVFTAQGQKKVNGTLKVSSTNELTKMNLIVVLGGDGTYLRAIRLLKGAPVPILGVNLGSLGFLTSTRAEDLFAAMTKVLSGKMVLEPRSLLEAKVHDNQFSQSFLALNDVVIERGSLSQLIDLKIHHNNNFIHEIKSDGLIISSPTGSTAYNLAAGGPILHPEVKAIVVTPIGSHSLTSRPLVFPDRLSLDLSITSPSHLRKKTAHLVIDGVVVLDLKNQTKVTVVRSRHDHWMIREPQFDYFALLQEKLKFGTRN